MRVRRTSSDFFVGILPGWGAAVLAPPQASPLGDALNAYFVENLKTVTVWYF